MTTRRAVAVLAIGALAGGTARTARAQEEPDQLTEEVAGETPEGDETSWSISAGGVLNTGNTESLQINAGTQLHLVRGIHGLEGDAQYVLGRAGNDYSDETANNLRGRLRYDLFFTDADAAFLAAAVRHDRFAGLAPRLQGQIGYLRNVFEGDEGKHRLWTEVGYDITYDRLDYDLLDLDPMIDPDTLPDDQVVHAARLFVGYDNHVSETLTYKTGAEALFNVESLSDFRLSWDNALRTSLGGSFQAEFKLSLQLDTEPVEGAKKLDTVTTLNLIYNLVSEDDEG